MTEDELLVAVMDALRLHGWTAQHVRRSDRALVMGEAGFPDIIAVRDGILLAAELKADRGRLSWAQGRWLAELATADAVEARVVRPRDLDPLLDELRRHHGRLVVYGTRGRLAMELDLADREPELPGGPARA